MLFRSDSSISPLFVSKYKRDEEFFRKTYPTTIRPQSKDIVRTWLYYTILRCEQLTGKAPWSKAWIMGYGVDEHGTKMSKSKGNVIDPLPIIQKFGADTFRFWSASEINLGYDFRCSEQKIESTKKFLSKLWNISRFLSGFPALKSGNPTASDKWILSELDKVVMECKKGYSEFNFFVPATAIREFTWNLFAAHYMEMTKGRAYGTGFSKEERDAAVHILHKVFSTILRLLAPITPFITDYLWQSFYSDKTIHAERFIEQEDHEDWTKFTKELVEFNSNIWNKKKVLGLSLKDSIDVKVPSSLEPFAKDLQAMHNLKY